MIFSEKMLLKGEDFIINKYITLHHPTLGDIFDYRDIEFKNPLPDKPPLEDWEVGERGYTSFAHMVCATPSDLKHQLFDMGHNFDEMDEFNLFCMIAGGFDLERSRIIFGDLNFQSLQIRVSQDGTKEIIDDNNELVIDKSIYNIIVEYIRKINGIEKNVDTCGNEQTRQVMINLSRSDYEVASKKEYKSTILPIVSTLVNSEGFKYDYETIWKLPLYSFYDSAKRIQHIKSVGYQMIGIYSGLITGKDIDKKQLNMFGEI